MVIHVEEIILSLFFNIFYLFLDLIFICFSSLIFIYLISIICNKEEFGLIILFFSFEIVFVIIINIINKVGNKNFINDINKREDEHDINFTDEIKLFFQSILYYFDFTPINSMFFSFIRLMSSIWKEEYINENNNDDITDSILKKDQYILYSIFAKSLNLLFYGLILIFYDSGYFFSMIQNLKFIFCYKKNNLLLPLERESKHILFKDNKEKENDENDDSLNEIKDNDSNNFNLNLLEKNNIDEISNNNIYNPYVIKEIERVINSGELSTKIESLNKTYTSCCCCKKVKAINNLYLILEPNEKFGILGHNGSGKTTIFKAITKEISYDSGIIYLFGDETKNNFYKIRTKIGYCPQTLPLFDEMMVKEIIQFYLNLKECDENVESISKKFYLDKYLEFYCKDLSEGNKRKLILAISLMNYPKLLLLDEPTAGVDPISKRLIWNNINNLSNDENIFNMIIATNSIKEAEILCDRVSWLKSGNFVYIGNPEDLKLQYSFGYKLSIKFDESYFFFTENLISPIPDLTENLLIKINNLIKFDNYPKFLVEYPNIGYFLEALIEIINKIKIYTNKISFIKVE